jgi:hypothetical protein
LCCYQIVALNFELWGAEWLLFVSILVSFV